MNILYTNELEKEIKSLRQQLADMTKERDKAKAMPMKYRRMEFNAQLQNENESLRQQLADHLKREVMLREALTESRRELDSCQKVIWLASDYGFDPAYVKGAQASIRKTDEALAATADLDGLTLCHAEPAAIVFLDYGGNGAVLQTELADNEPLYRAWSQRNDI